MAVLGLTSLLAANIVTPVFAAPTATGPAMAAAIAEEQNGAKAESAENAAETYYQRLMDNVIEYGEIGDLIHSFNVTVRNNQNTLQNSKNEENNEEMAAELEDEAAELEDRAAELEELYGGMPGMEAQAGGMYANYIYNAKALKNYAKQIRKQSKGTGLSDRLSKLQNEKVEAGLVASAQSMMNQYQQTRLQIESLQTQKELAQASYDSVAKQAAVGMATASQVKSAADALQGLEVSLMAQQNSLESLRQNLCVMMGWKFDDIPEIREIPAFDESRIAAMNLEEDRNTAFDNSYDRRIAAIEYTETADGSEKESKRRSLDQTEQTAKSSFEALYNAVFQSRAAYDSANLAYEMEKSAMDGAERKYQLGMVSRMEYLQQKAQFAQKETAKKIAELNLFQTMENYDWGKKGLIQSAGGAAQ